MKHYVTVLKDAIPGITAEDLDIPFNETGIHSLDSVILRYAIEGYFGFEIPDSDWNRFNTLSETLQYCQARKGATTWPLVCGAKVTTHHDQEIRIPQMANSALSENWLLKEMGDMHWELLAKGMEQKSSGFTDHAGNRLYAAFVRLSYALTPLNEFSENDTIHFDAGIKRFGNYTYYSSVAGNCNNKSIRANLMTSFSSKKANDNAQISKCSPEARTNHIEELDATPDFYIEHRLLKKGLLNEVQSGKYCFKITDSILETLCHTINPHYEINGVGLLYFASYPLIADTCASEFFKNTMGMKDYDATYHTTYRDVFYFANCNADDRIIVKLNSAEMLDDNKLKITASLYRESDNKLMARVLTVKQKMDKQSLVKSKDEINITAA